MKMLISVTAPVIIRQYKVADLIILKIYLTIRVQTTFKPIQFLLIVPIIIM